MKKLILLFLASINILYASTCDHKAFSLNAYDSKYEDITLYDIVNDLTRQCNISVIFSDNRSREKLEDSLSLINIKDYSLDELFKLLFNEHNLFYNYDRNKNILKISYYKMKNFNVNYVNMSELSTKSVKSISVGTSSATNDSTENSNDNDENSNSDTTKIVTSLKFSFWDKLETHIQEVLRSDEDYDKSTNKVLIDRDAAVVTVAGTKRQLDGVEHYLQTIQKRMHKQVMINAQILELTYDEGNSTGVDWSKFELNLYPSAHFADALRASQDYGWSFAANFNPTAVIKFLNNYGNVEVISNPKVLTLNNQPAIINVGNQLNYRYQSGDTSTTNSGGLASRSSYTLGSMFVGITLNIIPEITENDQIIMRINPVTSALLNEDELTKRRNQGDSGFSDSRNMPPDTKIKQMSSIVKVKDGQRVLIGGLIEKRKHDKNSKVPLLGDIPLIGKAFSHTGTTTQKTELFILLTPTLIKNQKFPTLNDRIIKRLN